MPGSSVTVAELGDHAVVDGDVGLVVAPPEPLVLVGVGGDRGDMPGQLRRRALVEGGEAQHRLLADVHLVDMRSDRPGCARSAACPWARCTSPARPGGSPRARCRRSSRRRCPTTGARRSSRAICVDQRLALLAGLDLAELQVAQLVDRLLARLGGEPHPLDLDLGDLAAVLGDRRPRPGRRCPAAAPARAAASAPGSPRSAPGRAASAGPRSRGSAGRSAPASPPAAPRGRRSGW